jgi:glycosyltransferase involved in cell wall biosynthesis
MGGAERVTLALFPHLDRARVTPLLCTVESKGESELVQQLGAVSRFDLGAKRLLDPAAYERLVRLLKVEGVDLIHAQLQYATVFGAYAVARTGLPMVVTRHLIGDDEKNWREVLRSWVERALIRRYVDKLIMVSEAAGVHYAKIACLDPSRIVTIYNGIDPQRFAPAEDKYAVRAALNLPSEGFIVIMVGVMRAGKGQDVLLDALANLPADTPPALFLLVGDGEERPALEVQTKRLGLANVRFLGQRMDIPDLLRAADLFVLPSDSEALPTVLLEAGAAGLPCIATRVGGIPEIIHEGENGLLIPPRQPQALAQAMVGLLKEPARLQAMGAKARASVLAKFTLSQQARATTDLYEKMVYTKNNVHQPPR